MWEYFDVQKGDIGVGVDYVLCGHFKTNATQALAFRVRSMKSGFKQQGYLRSIIISVKWIQKKIFRQDKRRTETLEISWAINNVTESKILIRVMERILTPINSLKKNY